MSLQISIVYFTVKMFRKSAVLQSKNKPHILSAGILLVLILINVALLIAFGITVEGKYHVMIIQVQCKFMLSHLT